MCWEVSKWLVSRLVTPIYSTYKYVYNPLILTIDPNFQRDIQEGIYFLLELAKAVNPYQKYKISIRPGLPRENLPPQR